MNTPHTPEKSGIQSFPNDFEYISAELEWVGARVQRLVVQRQLEELEGIRVQRGARHQVYVGEVSPQRVSMLEAEEKAIRGTIDARLALNRTGGPDIGLDRLCREHGLTEFDRNLLLLCFVPCLGNRHCEQILWRLDPVIRSTDVSVEAAALFLESSSDDMIKGLLRILPEAPLRQQGLVQLSYEPMTPADALTVGISLSGKAMATITGVPAFRGFCAPAETGDAR